MEPLKQGQDSILKEYGYFLTDDGKINVIEGRRALKQSDPAYREMIRRKNQYERLYLQKLNELGSTSYNNQIIAKQFANEKLSKKTGRYSVLSPTTLAEFRKTLNPKSEKNLNEVLIPAVKKELKKASTGKDKRKVIQAYANKYNIPVKILTEAVDKK